ncbi:MAG: DUF2167 domain-containing protein, partial [Methylocystis sp.]
PTKGLDLRIGEAAMPVAAATVAQAVKPADSATAPTPVAKLEAKPDAKPPVASAPNVPSAQAPTAQVQNNQAPNTEAEAYAALLAQGAHGPIEVRLADRATLWLPAGRVFLDGAQARKALGAARGVNNATLGVVLPATSRPDWMAYVSLIDDGHIADQDGKSFDANAMLGTLKAKVAAENLERTRAGLSSLEITGWIEAPSYDAKHNLSSCIGSTPLGSKNADDRFVNCSSYALGGQGALKIVVAGKEANLARFKGEASSLVDTIVYDKGRGYEDMDLTPVKTAPYGLVTLVTGVDLNRLAVANAAGAVKKLGLIALLVVYAVKFGKFVLIGVAAVAAAVRWMRRKRKPAVDMTPKKQEVVSEPIWRRLIQAARAKLASRGKKAMPVAASANEAAPDAEELEALDPERARKPEQAAARPARSGLGAKLALLRGKLPSLPFMRKPSELKPVAEAASPSQTASIARPSVAARPAVASPPVVAAAVEQVRHDDEPSASPLARLAYVMRKKAPEPPVHVDLSRVERRAYRGAAALAPAPIEQEIARPLPGAAPK